MKKRSEFAVGQTVWCCDNWTGEVFSGALRKAGPVSFRFETWRASRRRTFTRNQIFNTELHTRLASVEPLERGLIRVAEQLGDVRHRIQQLNSAESADETCNDGDNDGARNE